MSREDAERILFPVVVTATEPARQKVRQTGPVRPMVPTELDLAWSRRSLEKVQARRQMKATQGR